MTVGWGVIGAGGIANRTIPDGILMADNASFVGITDIHAERAKNAADDFGGRVYETADEMLADPIYRLFTSPRRRPSTPSPLYRPPARASMS